MPRTPRQLRTLLLVLPLLAAVACGGDDDEAAAAGATALRLGVFPNVTHAAGLAGIGGGVFAEHLGDHELDVSYFNAGPEAIEAVFAEAVDITYVGPNPAINAHAESDGDAVRIIAGATSGGAYLVVAPGVEEPDDLQGTTLATPQLGNTQDVALRSWLKEHGLDADTAGGGDVAIRPQANADTLAAMRAGEIDGAWVPEPWATRLVQEAGGHVLVDERDLWPDGEYVTTHVIVRTAFLDEHPDVVRAFLEGHVGATALVNEDAARAKELVNTQIEGATGKAIATDVLDAAWDHLTFTVDPIAASLAESKDDAVAVGLLDEVDLADIYDLTILNDVLRAAGDDEVKGL